MAGVAEGSGCGAAEASVAVAVGADVQAGFGGRLAVNIAMTVETTMAAKIIANNAGWSKMRLNEIGWRG